MNELTTNTSYLRATLKEALLDMGVRQHSQHGAKSGLDIPRDSRLIETVLLILDRLGALEKKS